ncbi:MAG: hypothetical protein HY530_00990 [Chloroflexi bacterium]|nr:hypothetical protein [Chloroflexota bacterium]
MDDIILEVASDFLYAKPSFIEGLGRVLDVGGTLNEYNSSPTGEIADKVAMRVDWACVGQYLRSAINEYAKEQAPKD